MIFVKLLLALKICEFWHFLLASGAFSTYNRFLIFTVAELKRICRRLFQVFNLDVGFFKFCALRADVASIIGAIKHRLKYCGYMLG
jgi:hypothetical protein